MGLVRLNAARPNMCFSIFWVRTLKLSSEMIKNWKFRLVLMILFIFSILWFDCSLDFGNPESFFSQWKNKCSHVSVYASRGGSWEKSSNDSRLTVITLNAVRHVPRAPGPFLWELPAKASGVEVESTWRVLRRINPRLISIKGFEGTNHEMSLHQVREKVCFSPSI